ncbi:MAG: TolC family protein, partial [Gelidibacter sp.]|nr:TolC family protein [Gelidibacter sp.]
MNKAIILTFILLLPLSVLSQEKTASFSLQEAIDYALQNNRTAKNAERDIEVAKQRKWETTATGLPQINGKIEYQNWLKQQVSLLPAAAFDNTQSVIDVVNDYFDANQTNFDVNSPDGFIPLRFGTKQTMNASVTLSQLIFD